MTSSVPPQRTLNGNAYCRICWNAVYALWIDDVDPDGVCPHGATKATDCADAMAHARNTAMIMKLRRTGLIREQGK